jgi:hypothetical protein
MSAYPRSSSGSSPDTKLCAFQMSAHSSYGRVQSAESEISRSVNVCTVGLLLHLEPLTHLVQQVLPSLFPHLAIGAEGVGMAVGAEGGQRVLGSKSRRWSTEVSDCIDLG